MFGLIAFVAFEAMAVATVMPTVARDLDGLGLYALAFAAPLASGVVGMVAAGTWSDRTGPVLPLLASMALFSAGLLVCGLGTAGLFPLSLALLMTAARPAVDAASAQSTVATGLALVTIPFALGAIADATSLRAALGAVPVLLLLAAAAAVAAHRARPLSG